MEVVAAAEKAILMVLIVGGLMAVLVLSSSKTVSRFKVVQAQVNQPDMWPMLVNSVVVAEVVLIIVVASTLSVAAVALVPVQLVVTGPPLMAPVGRAVLVTLLVVVALEIMVVALYYCM